MNRIRDHALPNLVHAEDPATMLHQALTLDTKGGRMSAWQTSQATHYLSVLTHALRTQMVPVLLQDVEAALQPIANKLARCGYTLMDEDLVVMAGILHENLLAMKAMELSASTLALGVSRLSGQDLRDLGALLQIQTPSVIVERAIAAGKQPVARAHALIEIYHQTARYTAVDLRRPDIQGEVANHVVVNIGRDGDYRELAKCYVHAHPSLGRGSRVKSPFYQRSVRAGSPLSTKH